MTVFAITVQMTIRSSHQRCSVRKGILRNFAKFTGKHLCHSLFFNKVVGLRPFQFFLQNTSGDCFWIKSNALTMQGLLKVDHSENIWRRFASLSISSNKCHKLPSCVYCHLSALVVCKTFNPIQHCFY